MKWITFFFSKTFLKQLLYAGGFFVLLFGALYIYLKFSTQHNESVTVPDLSGMAVSQVERVLREQDLNYAVVDSVYNENQRGTVLEQIPAPGAEVKSGREIYLTINSVLPPMKMMDVKLGESMRVAELKLKIAGIRYETEYRKDVCNDCVLKVLYEGKEIDRGFALRKGETVKLILGEKGSKKVKLPNFRAMTSDEAASEMKSLGVSLGYPFFDIDIKTGEDSLIAQIYDQNPKPGSLVKTGSPVDIWLTTQALESDSTATKNEK